MITLDTKAFRAYKTDRDSALDSRDKAQLIYLINSANNRGISFPQAIDYLESIGKIHMISDVIVIYHVVQTGRKFQGLRKDLFALTDHPTKKLQTRVASLKDA